MFLIFSSIKHFNKKHVDKTANIGGTSSVLGFVLRRLPHTVMSSNVSPD